MTKLPFPPHSSHPKAPSPQGFPLPAPRSPLPASRFPLPASRFPLPASRFPLPATMIRHYVFDIGNVILKFDFGRAAARVADRCRLPEAEIVPALQPMHEDLETGRLSADDFIAEAVRRTGFTGYPAEFRRAFQEIFEVNEPIAALVEALHGAGQPLYLLSNTSDLHVSFFTREYDRVFDRFRDAVYSHEAGCMKPDPAIFRIAAERFGLDPAETVYLDDLPANVAAAVDAGYRGLIYDHRDHDGFRSRFDALVGAGLSD